MTNTQALAVVLLSAFFVYSIRFLGLALGKRLPKTGVFKKGMDALPGTIFAALVFPGLLAAGWQGIVAAVFIVIITKKTGNVMLAMLTGVAAVALLRIPIF
ncbi:MAG: AzlD domain-containing protein [Synergistaceae bacterium]|nr:AzlD domain-containing protein [Synergistaceae bacterium]